MQRLFEGSTLLTELKQNRGAYWNSGAYWNEGAYVIGALIKKTHSKRGVLLEKGRLL